MRLVLLAITFAFVVQLGESGEKPPIKKFDGEAPFIEILLKQMDANGDGKIAKSEVKGKLADGFAFLDSNKDGFLDRTELRAVAQRMMLQKKGPEPAGGGTDFDSLDRNADGRLSLDELRGSRLAPRFEEIDADRSGQIDRREFELYLKKQEKLETK